jgi:AraC-like DNA-binding protein/ligand-binding sensor protein
MATSSGQSAFAILEQVHAARGFEPAFRQATGLPIRLRALPRQANAVLIEPDDNPLCLLACRTAAGRAVCQQTQAEIRHDFEEKKPLHPVACIAGLTIISVPVRVCGNYVATLHTNRVFTRPPQPEDIQRFADQLAAWGAQPDLQKLQQDFAPIPIVPPEHLDAILTLLNIYAEHLGDLAGRRILAERRGRPSAVAQALAYVREHQQERLHLREVADQAHLSPYYFCKLFHKTTGMTFTEYLARLRLEASKNMLLNQATPIGDIALTAGFGSVPHFNRAFKRYTGLTPSRYRAMHAGFGIGESLLAQPLAA